MEAVEYTLDWKNNQGIIKMYFPYVHMRQLKDESWISSSDIVNKAIKKYVINDSIYWSSGTGGFFHTLTMTHKFGEHYRENGQPITVKEWRDMCTQIHTYIWREIHGVINP